MKVAFDFSEKRKPGIRRLEAGGEKASVNSAKRCLDGRKSQLGNETNFLKVALMDLALLEFHWISLSLSCVAVDLPNPPLPHFLAGATSVLLFPKAAQGVVDFKI